MNESIQSITARTVLARFTAALFAEPDERWKERIRDAGIVAELGGALRTLKLPNRLLLNTLDGLEDIAELQRERTRLMGHAVKSLCPAYELEYQREFAAFHEALARLEETTGSRLLD